MCVHIIPGSTSYTAKYGNSVLPSWGRCQVLIPIRKTPPTPSPLYTLMDCFTIQNVVESPASIDWIRVEIKVESCILG